MPPIGAGQDWRQLRALGKNGAGNGKNDMAFGRHDETWLHKTVDASSIGIYPVNENGDAVTKR
jgi:hypothetical protein